MKIAIVGRVTGTIWISGFLGNNLDIQIVLQYNIRQDSPKGSLLLFIQDRNYQERVDNNI